MSMHVYYFCPGVTTKFCGCAGGVVSGVLSEFLKRMIPQSLAVLQKIVPTTPYVLMGVEVVAPYVGLGAGSPETGPVVVLFTWSQIKYGGVYGLVLWALI